MVFKRYVHGVVASIVMLLSCSLLADPFNLVLVGSLGGLGSNSCDVDVVGDYAYVTITGNAGTFTDTSLKIINIANKSSPYVVGSIPMQDAKEVKVIGNYAYVADHYRGSSGGLKIVNISNPAAPTLVGTLGTSNDAFGLDIVGNYAYVANFFNVVIGNVSSQTSPSLLSTTNTGDSGVLGVVVSGSYAYVANSGSGLKILNVSNPSSPSLVGSLSTSCACAVTVSGNYAYLCDRAAGFKVINVANPAAPTLVGSLGTTAQNVTAQDVTVIGSYAYVADGSAGFKIINVSNPAAPVVVNNLPTTDAQGLKIVGNYAYVADGSAGLKIIQIQTGTPTLQSITVTPSSASIVDGNTQQFTATGTYSDSSTQNITNSVSWNSSNTSVATINSSGVATSVDAGTTNISATLSGITSSARVLTVTAVSRTLQSITVTPSSASIVDGNTQQFTATGTYSDSSTQNITSSATWNSSDTSVATITSSGLATALDLGTTNITATLSGITSSARVLTVAEASHAPVAHKISKSGTVNAILAFSVDDFVNNFTDAPGNSLAKVKITSLPSYGTLKLLKNNVAVNQEIAVGNLSSLTYVPEVNWDGNDSFNWEGSDGTMYSNDYAEVTITISTESSFCADHSYICYVLPPVIAGAGIVVGVLKYMHKNHLWCFKDAASALPKVKQPQVTVEAPHIEIVTTNYNAPVTYNTQNHDTIYDTVAVQKPEYKPHYYRPSQHVRSGKRGGVPVVECDPV